MNSLRSSRITLAALLAALVLGLLACSPKQEPADTEVSANLTEAQKQALLERVEAKWRAMERHDFGATYRFTTPNYRRVFSKDMYLRKFGYDVRWELTGIEVVNYDARAAVASVAVRVMSESTKQTTLASRMGPVPVTINEKWLFVDGEWWNSAK